MEKWNRMRLVLLILLTVLLSACAPIPMTGLVTWGLSLATN